MYLESDSKHPSQEQSYTPEGLFYLYFNYFNSKKRLHPAYTILPNSVMSALSINEFLYQRPLSVVYSTQNFGKLFSISQITGF